MAKQCSFDIVSEIDLQEEDNAVNQAKKEIQLRYDFKNSQSKFEFDRENQLVVILAADEMKLKSMQEILKVKFAKRGIPVKSLEFEKEERAFEGFLRQSVKLLVGISKDNAKMIVKDIKETKIKVQPSIQGEQIRVSGKKIDDLQQVMGVLKGQEYRFPLQFVNYRN